MKNLISGMIAGTLAILFCGCEENLMMTKNSVVDLNRMESMKVPVHSRSIQMELIIPIPKSSIK